MKERSQAAAQGHLPVCSSTVSTEANPFDLQIAVTATGRRLRYDLRLEVAGSVASPAVRFSSSPPLDSERVLLLVMAGESPVGEIDYSGQQRFVRLGAYLGQSFVSRSVRDPARADRRTDLGRAGFLAGKETHARSAIRSTTGGRWSASTSLSSMNTTWGMADLPRPRVGAEPPKDPAREPAVAPVPVIDSDDRRHGGLTARSETAAAAETEQRSVVNRPARVHQEGLGIPGETGRCAHLDGLGEDYAGVLDRNAIEDAMFLVMSSLADQGYLAPTVNVELKDAASRVVALQFDAALTTPLPEDMSVHWTNLSIDLC